MPSVPLRDAVFTHQTIKAWYCDSLRPILERYTDKDEKHESEARVALKLHLRDTWVYGLLDSPLWLDRPLSRLRARYLRFVKRHLGHNLLLEQCFKYRWSKLENPYFHSNALRSLYTPVLNTAPYYHKYFSGQFSRKQLEKAIESELKMVAKKLDHRDCFMLYFFLEQYDPSGIIRRLDSEQHPLELMPDLYENEACEFWRDLRSALQMGEKAPPIVRNAKPWEFNAILVALIPKRTVVNLPAIVFPPPSRIVSASPSDAFALREYPFTLQEERSWLMTPEDEAITKNSDTFETASSAEIDTRSMRTTYFWNNIALDRASKVLDRTDAIRDLTGSHIPLLAPFVRECNPLGGPDASSAYMLESKYEDDEEEGGEDRPKYSVMLETLIGNPETHIDVALKKAHEALQNPPHSIDSQHPKPSQSEGEEKRGSGPSAQKKGSHQPQRTSKANAQARANAKSWVDAIPSELTKRTELRVVPLLDLLEHPTNDVFIEHLITPLSHIAWSKKSSIVLLVPTAPPLEDRNWVDHGLISKADLIGPKEEISHTSSPCSGTEGEHRQDEEILLF
jgi:hypothetical protein